MSSCTIGAIDAQLTHKFVIFYLVKNLYLSRDVCRKWRFQVIFSFISCLHCLSIFWIRFEMDKKGNLKYVWKEKRETTLDFGRNVARLLLIFWLFSQGLIYSIWGYTLYISKINPKKRIRNRFLLFKKTT